MDSSTRLLLFAFALFVAIASTTANVEEIQKRCQSVEGLKSCGLCMKQHPECAWCADPEAKGPRCDHKSAFERTCPNAMSASGNSELSVPEQHNFPIGFEHPHTRLPIQISPQQAFMRLKPGDSLRMAFTYRHMRPAMEVQNMALQTSDLASIGLDIQFEVECHGQLVQGKVCENVREGDEIKFFATVMLKECKAGNDVAVSIGVYGYNMVSAIFVTPLCTCECEKVKQPSFRDYACNAAGALVCGQCVCAKGFGGRKCECDLARHGVTTAEELDNKCRSSPEAPVCGGKGTCECGRCRCQANFVRGEFCECDSTTCPKDAQGRLCSGRGECDCGRCRCEEGFDGDDCACSSDEAPCRENGKVCSDNGRCSCGKCACNDGFTGAFCSVATPSDAKDGATLNDVSQPEDVAGPEMGDEGALLPAEEEADDTDAAVDVPTPQEQEGDAESSDSAAIMQTMLSLLLGLVTLRFALHFF